MCSSRVSRISSRSAKKRYREGWPPRHVRRWPLICLISWHTRRYCLSRRYDGLASICRGSKVKQMTSSRDPRDGSRSFHLLVNIFPVDESLSNECNLAARSGSHRYGRCVFERTPAASCGSSARPVPGGGSSITCSTDPSARDRKVYPARLSGPLTRIRRCLLRILAGQPGPQVRSPDGPDGIDSQADSAGWQIGLAVAMRPVRREEYGNRTGFPRGSVARLAHCG